MRRQIRILGKSLLLLLACIAGLIAIMLVIALVVYPAQYVYRVLVWQESDAFDWQKFPSQPLNPAPDPTILPVALDAQIGQAFQRLAGVDDWDTFLAENQTQAFIVIHDGAIVYENYFNNSRRDSIVTSFSVAKSFTSALIGIAIDEGHIQSVDDPITQYLPELGERDPRFHQISIRHLLLMSSGLDYQEFRTLLFNSDDPLTTYYPDQRALALNNTHIIEPPLQRFHYNKYHPQLLGMILERATGRRVTTYLQDTLWDPLGMVYAGSWSTDSVESDFEKMETGVNARALDFAKFGMLFLNEGIWQGRQVISQEWIAESTQPNFSEIPANYYPNWFSTAPWQGYYSYMWWGLARATIDDEMLYDYAAIGDKGQYIYVSPHKRLVIVRNGIQYGIPFERWLELFYHFASEYGNVAQH